MDTVTTISIEHAETMNILDSLAIKTVINNETWYDINGLKFKVEYSTELQLAKANKLIREWFNKFGNHGDAFQNDLLGKRTMAYLNEIKQ